VLDSNDNGKSFTLHRQLDRSGNMMALPVAQAGLLLMGESGVQRLTESSYRAGGVQ
jgi:hypothetical protein